MRPATPRLDMTLGDITALVALGIVEELPPAPCPRPDPPRPEPPPDVGERQQMLTTALTDTGAPVTEEDRDAVADVARMDPDTVQAVTRWIERGRPPA